MSAIFYDMEYEIKNVKGYKKTYIKKSGEKKETISKSIQLGSKTIFNADDEVIIIAKSDFNKLLDENNKIDNVDMSAIAELKKQLAEKDEIINELKSKTDNYISVSDELNKSKNIVIMLQNKEKYLEKIILMYETFGLIDRIKKTNPKDTVDVSADYELLD